MATKKKRRTFDGEVSVCAHRVSFWYDIGERELTDELRERLGEEAESRAKECIIEGCISGELNCLYDDGSEDAEIRGWWDICRD